MSVRKRIWKTRKGEQRESWLVDYVDQQGKRHIQTFDRKRDADEYHATVRVDVRKGVHSAPSKSVTVAEAAQDWLTHVEREGRWTPMATCSRVAMMDANWPQPKPRFWPSIKERDTNATYARFVAGCFLVFNILRWSHSGILIRL
jgi:hypothetical protein